MFFQGELRGVLYIRTSGNYLDRSNRIKELRKEQNISQDRLANALGISRRSVSKIENGDQNPSLEMAYRIAAYFQLFVQEVNLFDFLL